MKGLEAFSDRPAKPKKARRRSRDREEEKKRREGEKRGQGLESYTLQACLAFKCDSTTGMNFQRTY